MLIGSMQTANIITMTAGDSFYSVLFINKGTLISPVRYELQTNDKVYLSIMEPNQEFENGIIRKVYTSQDINADGDIEIYLSPEDTQNVIAGTYYYSVKLQMQNDIGDAVVCTICPPKKFIIY